MGGAGCCVIPAQKTQAVSRPVVDGGKGGRCLGYIVSMVLNTLIDLLLISSIQSKTACTAWVRTGPGARCYEGGDERCRLGHSSAGRG